MHDSIDSIMSEIVRSEEQLLRNDIRQNAGALAKILHDNCINIDEQGKKEFSKGQCLDPLEGVLYITDDKSKINILSDNIVLITYEAAKVKKDKRTKANCSSIWKKENEKWKVIFHQITIVNEDKK